MYGQGAGYRVRRLHQKAPAPARRARAAPAAAIHHPPPSCPGSAWGRVAGFSGEVLRSGTGGPAAVGDERGAGSAAGSTVSSFSPRPRAGKPTSTVTFHWPAGRVSAVV
ncbi:hypothetical protein BLA24_13120 [Streptomyces cinnamoneus]|uniref:Uncharacterized protein n=1 Tax=Streptomyces cinnamoneus TaxID=53446 RepID=A0A2G1XJX6_STRCJ|nr:hypothetical protein BLA24_13120 [Streptomyces cinnamoneus]